MKKVFKTIVISSVFCICGLTVQAEDLFSTLQYTYQNSPQLEASRAFLRSVDERVAQAKAGWRPTVGVEANAAYMDQKYKDYPGTKDDSYGNDMYDAGVSLSQSVFAGFRTTSSMDYAQTIVREQREGLRTTEQSVLLSAAISFVDLIRDKAVLELRKNQEVVLNRHLESYKKRFKVGDLTKTDVAQSEARLAGAKANRIDAEGNLKVSKAAYRSVVGKSAPETMKIDNLEKLLPDSLTTALKTMENDNPTLLSARYSEEAAGYNITLQRSALLPSVDVSAGAGLQWGQPLPTIKDDYDGEYWRVGAKLFLPLYQGGSEYSKVREAKQLENQARIYVEQVRRDLIKATTQAWEQYQTTKASIVSIKSQIKASKMALDGVIREAEVGARTVLDVLDAEQEHLNNQVNLVTAERNMTIAELQLLAAMGKMTVAGLNLQVEPYNPEVYYREVADKWIGTSIE